MTESRALFYSLEEMNPSLAAEWHPTKNGGLLPSGVLPQSNKKVWWQCEKGHEWETKISNRTALHRGCPYCSGQKVLTGYNDLATLDPKVAAEWHPSKNGDLTPFDVTRGSGRKIWWQCEKGHEWQASISNRCKGNDCPICNNEKHTSFPEKAVLFYLSSVFSGTVANQHFDWLEPRELDIYIPSLKIAVEYDGEAWHRNPEKDIIKNSLCDQRGVRLIRIREPGCPLISAECIKLKSRSDNQLNVAIQQLCAILGKQVDVNIDRDRIKIYEAYIEGEKQNSLAGLNPKVAAEWHSTKNGNLAPSQIAKSSRKKVWWQCEKGHEWQATVDHRNRGRGCPICAGKAILPGFNDLATTHPELLAEWHPTKNSDLTPEQVTASSNKKVWWLGKYGHEWQAPISDRNRGRGCPICAGRKVLPGVNDLAAVYPDLAAEWHLTKNEGLMPEQVTAGSGKKVWWQCEKGHEWQARIVDRTKGNNCPICYKNKNKTRNEQQCAEK